MTKTIFDDTKASLAVFREMVDSANADHKAALETIAANYRGDMFVKMRASEKAEHKKRLEDLRQTAYDNICEDIKKVRSQITTKAQKRDFKALNELGSLSGLRLSQAEFDLLYKEYDGNYWNIRRLAEVAREQGLEMPEPFAPLDKQLGALSELQEAARLFILGTNAEANEVFDKYGHRQTFPGYGDSAEKSNVYERNLLVSDREIDRMKNTFLAENPLFSEGALINDVIKGMFGTDGTMRRVHYLNNRLENLTKNQAAEVISKLSEDESSEVQCILSLLDFKSVVAENKEGAKNE